MVAPYGTRAAIPLAIRPSFGIEPRQTGAIAGGRASDAYTRMREIGLARFFICGRSPFARAIALSAKTAALRVDTRSRAIGTREFREDHRSAHTAANPAKTVPAAMIHVPHRIWPSW